MKKSSSGLFLYFVLSLTLQAQQTGKVDYKQLGVSFVIPDGWVGQETGAVYLMGHNTIPGFIILIPHSQSLTTEQMMNEAKAGLNLGGGSQLQPAGELSMIADNQVGGEFEGSIEYTPAKAYVVGMANPHGKGLTIIAATSHEAYESGTYMGLAKQVTASVVFSSVPAAGLQGRPGNNGKTGSELEDWKYQLGGTKLTYLESYSSGGSTGGGYNMKTEIHLCQAGYFLYYAQNFVSAGTSHSNIYSAGKNNGDGSWDIVKENGWPYLLLKFNNGEQKAFQLEWREDTKLFLDGYRYFRTWEGSEAPHCTQ